MSASLKRPAETNGGGPPASDTNEGGDLSRQRKFFPRLKTLLSDEYEDFLRQVIEIVESNQCAAFPMATADTPWADAFEAIYQTVASDYALPQGKNRLHKFKEKMVELWSAMQGEVTLGVKSDAHPIYRTALKQWKLHQSVMKDKTKAHATPNAASLGGREDGGEGGGSDPEMEEGMHRPRKKTRSSGFGADIRRSLPSQGVHHHHPASLVDVDAHAPGGASSTANLVTMPGEMMESWLKSLSRLEFMLTAGGLLPQRLPSPLYELHCLKARMPETEFDAKVRSVYDQEIGRHLAHVTAQCRTSSQPGYLPHLLEGLDMLRQSQQTPTIRKSLDFAHKHVLTKYVTMISRESPTTGNNTTKELGLLPLDLQTPKAPAAPESPVQNNTTTTQASSLPPTGVVGAPVLEAPTDHGALGVGAGHVAPTTTTDGMAVEPTANEEEEDVTANIKDMTVV